MRSSDRRKTLRIFSFDVCRIRQFKHNTSTVNDDDALASAANTPGSHSPSHIATPATAVFALQSRRPFRLASHDASTVLSGHSRRDPFSVNYSLWPFDHRDYAIVCTVINHMIRIYSFLWTPLLTLQGCIQHRGCCCNRGSTEHSLRCCTAPC